ncbi:MAG: 2-oxoglutarate dehydrogenase E1 component [Gammaproteobacteria bacterium]|nr:2-oxoglutarate dehydrogenase E1 component [Gammaproteobacteria bacterium]MYF01879.1 2-oxoglutarate dehydrogenase E1 component [Gammaproteobacteria bacterium]
MTDSFLERMEASSHLAGGSVAYIEAMYEKYLESANLVPQEWRDYFHTLPQADNGHPDIAHSTIVHHFERLGRNRLKARPERVSTSILSEYHRKQIQVMELIESYQSRGHRKARIDPLGVWERDKAADLELKFHGLSMADFDTVFHIGSSHLFTDKDAKLRDIVDALEKTYCGSIGTEYVYVTSTQEREWIRGRLESVHSQMQFDDQTKYRILERLTAAEGLERYLHNRYPGTKRFGLEGAESLIPMLHEITQRSGMWRVQEVVIGMAHRGRLNVLVNLLGKQASELFQEFEGRARQQYETGDVKYHMGFSTNLETHGRQIHLALAFNPSHLEIVGPVVEGSCRARQDRRADASREQVFPILIHGDAAIAGQGVVMETFQMSQTRGFSTGGTMHIIINNQVGFTTSRLEDARSTEYCSEVAKIIRAPIFHVNADDPEAVTFVAQIASDYVNVFGKDVVIDLVCYRRRGHNEAEDPMKTQPLMYQQIRRHPTTRKIYADRLAEEGVVSQDESEVLAATVRDRLDRGETIALSVIKEPDTSMFVDWKPYIGHNWDETADTSFPLLRLQQVMAKANRIRKGTKLHKQVQGIYADRHNMAAGGLAVNWGFGEMAAYATLLDQGFDVRITGQDVGVGTFSHRHACVYCQSTGEQVIPMQEGFKKRRFEIYDSLLSEEAVLAFEYGYATTTPNTLVIWEAQFGDFANGAQVVFDQFISSGEAKWGRQCGLVVFLPHGLEGQGPEHSSARLERFMQMCAQHNIQVCIPTTPSQIFHLLRRQMIRPMRRPLIVLTPKSLLRHKLATSTIDELSTGSFRNVIDEYDPLKPKEVERLVLCSGKVYYDLLARRREANCKTVGIVRLEQLYPFPLDEFLEVLSQYSALKTVVWCQEEPKNQGAWYSSKHHMERAVATTHQNLTLKYAGRKPYAAPAVGLPARHARQQRELVEEALFGNLEEIRDH